MNLLGKWKQCGTKLGKLRASLAHHLSFMGLSQDDQISFLDDIVKLIELCWVHFDRKKNSKRNLKL